VRESVAADDRMSERLQDADSLGIEQYYFDVWGTPRTVSDETMARLRAALTPRNGATAAHPPIVLLRRGAPAPSELSTLPEGASWRLISEPGGTTVAEGIAENGRCDLPDGLPLGPHLLNVEGKPALRLLVAPAAAYQGEATGPEKVWLLAVQLYAVRSRRNWGHGDFTDLANLLALANEIGAAGIGLNPLHALFDDRPEQASPYAPNSRLFLNTLYIDAEALPEFPGIEAGGLSDAIRALRETTMVDYTGVAAAKGKALRLAFANFRTRRGTAHHRAFAAFRAERGEDLRRFAAFEVLRRRFGDVWWNWPDEWRSPSPGKLAALEKEEPEELLFHTYVQCMAVGLYLDVAVGVEPGGADAWSAQDSVIPQVEVGAPPDLLNTAGQAWGLAAFSPRALEADAFRPFSALLAAAMRHAGAIRLDHVLGLNRFYLIPFGLGAQDGAYVRYPLHLLLAAVAIESVRYRCLVIGEDLGTVPDELRAVLADWGVWSYLVMLFERHADGTFRHPHEYRRNALVTFSTHDLPSFEGWRTDHDLAVKRAIGLDPGESDEQRTDAHRLMRTLMQECALQQDREPDLPDVLRFLARTPSRMLVVALDDILGVRDQPNVPGTTTEHPNWRRRLPDMLEDIAEDPRLRAVGDILREEGRADDRRPAP